MQVDAPVTSARGRWGSCSSHRRPRSALAIVPAVFDHVTIGYPTATPPCASTRRCSTSSDSPTGRRRSPEWEDFSSGRRDPSRVPGLRIGFAAYSRPEVDVFWRAASASVPRTRRAGPAPPVPRRLLRRVPARPRRQQRRGRPSRRPPRRRRDRPRLAARLGRRGERRVLRDRRPGRRAPVVEVSQAHVEVKGCERLPVARRGAPAATWHRVPRNDDATVRRVPRRRHGRRAPVERRARGAPGVPRSTHVGMLEPDGNEHRARRPQPLMARDRVRRARGHRASSRSSRSPNRARPRPGAPRGARRSVDPFDWKACRSVPGSRRVAGGAGNGRGVVNALGEGVTALAAGTPSSASRRPRVRNLCRSPPEDRLVAKPDALPWEGAPGSPAPAAWPGRCSSASARRGDTLLSGPGGVGRRRAARRRARRA